MPEEITTVNPATDEKLASYEIMSDAVSEAAIRDCHEAFLEWRGKTLDQRASVISAIADALRKNEEEFSKLMTREVGKLIGDSREEIQLCASICDYTADNGPDLLADEERPIPGGKGLVTYAPLGVIYGIQPWNFPGYQAIRYTVANLMAGNGVLLKHAQSCTGSALYLRDLIAEAGVPDKLFTVLVIDHEQSDKVIDNKLVRGVTLTGSESAGRTVAQRAGAMLKKTVLELGSNDAYLVLDDADIDLAVETCVMGRLYNSGQTCVNAKRLIVTDKNHDEFVDRYTEKMSAIKLGDPSDSDTKLVPMSRTSLRDALARQVEESIDKGARLTCGGQVPERNGAWYPATVLVNVQKGQPAYDDELFGPVASVIRARDDEEAMRIANDSRFGLGGGIIGSDVNNARELASKHFDTGMVSINGYNIALPNMPFGGVKNSGYGREHGGFGMKEFVNIKSLYISEQ